MPEFNQEAIDRIIKRFTTVAPNARCPLCGKDDFGVFGGVVPLPVQKVYPDPFRAVRNNDDHFPCITLRCNTCGHTMLINIMTLSGGELDDLYTFKWPEGR